MASAPARETEAEKAGWTPGPWRFNESHALIENVNGKGRGIAELSSLSDEDIANACLIAAAPEMYEALKLASLFLDHLKASFSHGVCEHTQAMMDDIKRVLSKAEGRS